MELKDKIALVTGASRGIGKARAIELIKQGATVIGADINQELVDQISEYIKGNGTGIVMDVTNQDSINGALEKIRTDYGAPEILVNNAGITRDNLMLRMKSEEWDAVIATNLTGVFKVTQACLRDMLKARKGKIINIASVVGLTGNPGQVNYSAAKAGLITFGKSLALEVASRGITVNAVAPGFIDTQMTRNLSAEHRQLLLNAVPLQRAGQPEDVAAAVAFLASSKADYITGLTIHVNGGMFMA